MGVSERGEARVCAAHILTNIPNIPAVRLYESVGFRLFDTIYAYAKTL